MRDGFRRSDDAMPPSCRGSRGRGVSLSPGHGGRLILLWSLLLTLFSLSPSDSWAARKGEPQVEDSYRVWARVSFEALEWKTQFNQLTLAEGLDIGSRGFILDPYLINYALEAGLIDYHLHRFGSWNTTIGWRGLASFTFAPASKFPLQLFFSRSTQGLAPGGHPAFNLSNATDIGGRWILRFAGWPQVFLNTNYTLTDYNVGPGGASAVFAENLQRYAETRLRSELKVLRATKSHRYEMRLELYDDAENRNDRRLRRGRFYAVDRAKLGRGFELQGVVTGEVGSLGNASLESATSFSNYRAWLYLLHARSKAFRFSARSNFYQAQFERERQLAAEFISEVYWYPRGWLELFSGLSLGYIDESDDLIDQREAREQLGLGARAFLPLPWVRGLLEARILGRMGDGQAIGQGRGVFTAVDLYLKWDRRFGRSLEVFMMGRTSITRDRSPLGTDRAVHLGRLGLGHVGRRRFSVQGYAFVSYREQEEVFQGSFTDTFTDVGGQLLFSFRPASWLFGRMSATYSRFITSELGAQSSLSSSAFLMIQPSRALRLQSAAYYVGRISNDELSSSVRVETEFSWRLRQLTVDATYTYILDDYRGIRGGDHRAMLRLTRTFDVRLGGRGR